MHGSIRKHCSSHHDFRKAIACTRINLEIYITEEFEVHSEILAPRRKIILDLSSSFSVLAMAPDRAQSTKSIDQHQNHHKLQRKVILRKITWPLMGNFTLSWTETLSTFNIHLERKQGAAIIGGLV